MKVGDRTEKEKMLAGELYSASDPELQVDQQTASAWMVRYNASSALSVSARHVLLREQLGTVGQGAVIRPPFYCDYGYNIHLGENAFLNFNCVVLDVGRVDIGAGSTDGPRCPNLQWGKSPRDAAERRTGLEFWYTITIGRNVWIGGGSMSFFRV